MYNRAILIGRLVADPELKTTPQGNSVTNFRLAVDRGIKTKSGDKVTDFITVQAWRQTAEFICKYFAKGRLVGIEGAIQTRNYEDKDGNKRTAVEVVADRAFFTESKGTGHSAEVEKPATIGGFEVQDEDSDLPF